MKETLEYCNRQGRSRQAYIAKHLAGRLVLCLAFCLVLLPALQAQERGLEEGGRQGGNLPEGQEEAPPIERKKKADTLKLPWKLWGIKFGVDVLPAIQGLTNNERGGFELNAEFEVRNYLFTLDYGTSSRNINTADTLFYENSGSYFRLGWLVNFIPKDVGPNAVFWGLQYVRTSFDDALRYTDTGDPYGDYVFNGTHDNVTGSWVEMVFGTRIRVYKQFYMGYTARYKFRRRLNGTDDFAPYQIPGYGLTQSNTTWGFSYHLMYRLPIRKIQSRPTRR